MLTQYSIAQRHGRNIAHDEEHRKVRKKEKYD